MDEVRLSIENLDRFFDRAAAAARRIDGGDERPEPASLTFESMELFLKTLTPNRWVLLRRLRSTGPSSVRALSRSLGRDYRGVHADVSALRDVGLVERRSDGKVFIPWSRITAEMSIDMAA